MGGNVFPGKTRRYNRAEYLAIEEYLSDSVFSALFEKFEVCPYLPSKETFGDMDVVCVPAGPLDIDRLKDWFETDHVKRNGDCYSLVYEELQIDIIVSNELEYEFHRNYLGVFDRGNFVGKVAHMLGLKFGHDGLFLPVRSSDSHKLGDIVLTRDPRVAEDFLDIKPLVNAQSFQDVFDNVVASKYFNPEVFLLENNNAVARIRDKKRPSYHQFLELCETLPAREYFPRSADKAQYLPMIFDAFPNAKEEYRVLFAKKEKLDALKLIFNGDLVSEYTGLTGKELGQFMMALKHKYDNDLLLSMGKEVVEHVIKLTYQEYNKCY